MTLWLLIAAIPSLGLGHHPGVSPSTRGLQGPSTPAAPARDRQQSQPPRQTGHRVSSWQGWEGSVARAVGLGAGGGLYLLRPPASSGSLPDPRSPLCIPSVSPPGLAGCPDLCVHAHWAPTLHVTPTSHQALGHRDNPPPCCPGRARPCAPGTRTLDCSIETEMQTLSRGHRGNAHAKAGQAKKGVGELSELVRPHEPRA